MRLVGTIVTSCGGTWISQDLLLLPVTNKAGLFVIVNLIALCCGHSYKVIFCLCLVWFDMWSALTWTYCHMDSWFHFAYLHIPNLCFSFIINNPLQIRCVGRPTCRSCLPFDPCTRKLTSDRIITTSTLSTKATSSCRFSCSTPRLM